MAPEGTRRRQGAGGGRQEQGEEQEEAAAASSPIVAGQEGARVRLVGNKLLSKGMYAAHVAYIDIDRSPWQCVHDLELA